MSNYMKDCPSCDFQGTTKDIDYHYPNRCAVERRKPRPIPKEEIICNCKRCIKHRANKKCSRQGCIHCYRYNYTEKKDE